MSRNKISTHRNKYKNGIQKVHYLQSYIILKDNSIKECILKTVRVNDGHCGRSGAYPKLYLVILVSGKLALRGWFGVLETFLQILWSCTLSNSPISNFLDMYLRLKHENDVYTFTWNVSKCPAPLETNHLFTLNYKRKAI